GPDELRNILRSVPFSLTIALSDSATHVRTPPLERSPANGHVRDLARTLRLRRDDIRGGDFGNGRGLGARGQEQAQSQPNGSRGGEDPTLFTHYATSCVLPLRRTATKPAPSSIARAARLMASEPPLSVAPVAARTSGSVLES